MKPPKEHSNEPSQLPQFREVKAKRKFKAAQRLTIPLFSLSHTPLMLVEVKAEMYEADMSIGEVSEKAGKPTVCLVLNLDTEMEGLLICNEIVKSTFMRVPDGYVGKVFRLEAGQIRDGKKYRDIDIVLMEEES